MRMKNKSCSGVSAEEAGTPGGAAAEAVAMSASLSRPPRRRLKIAPNVQRATTAGSDAGGSWRRKAKHSASGVHAIPEQPWVGRKFRERDLRGASTAQYYYAAGNARCRQ